MLLAATKFGSIFERDAWKKHLMNIKYEVRAVSGATGIAREAISLRERLTEERAVIQRTPLSMLLMVVSLREDMQKTKGKVTTEKVLQWLEECHWAKESEKPTKAMLDNSFALWTKFQAEPRLLHLVQEAELEYGTDSPFQSVAQMYLITVSVKKADSKQLLWLFNGVLHGKREGYVLNEDISKNRLSSKSSGQISPIDLLAFKQGLLEEMLNEQLKSVDFTNADAAKVQSIYSGHESLRGAGRDGAAWKAGLPEHQQKFLTILQDAVYNKLHDSCLRQCIKLAKLATDACRYGSLGQALQADCFRHFDGLQWFSVFMICLHAVQHVPFNSFGSIFFFKPATSPCRDVGFWFGGGATCGLVAHLSTSSSPWETISVASSEDRSFALFNFFELLELFFFSC